MTKKKTNKDFQNASSNLTCFFGCRWCCCRGCCVWFGVWGFWFVVRDSFWTEWSYTVPSWGHVGLCWPVLEVCWTILRLCWPIFGAMLAHFGAMLAVLLAHLDAVMVYLESPILGHIKWFFSRSRQGNFKNSKNLIIQKNKFINLKIY